MAYAPRQRKYKVRWKIAVPLILLVALVLYAVAGLLFPQKKEEAKKFTVCGLNSEETIHLLNKKAADTLTVRDYVFYGESLGLYTQTYDAKGDKDELAGKTVELHNLCTDETIPMTMDSTADQKITLEDLNPGYYEITVIDNLVKKRVIFDRTLHSDTFTTVQRKGNVNAIKLIADQDLLKDYDSKLDQNYLFLSVEKAKPKEGDIDVLLDPYGMNMDLTYVPDEGNKGNGITEYKETYKAAVWMKEELEQHGLRVEITKSDASEQPKPAYGKDGRLADGYQKHARYYIYLRFNTNPDENVSGMEIWHSAYSSPTLGKNIMYGLEKKLKMSGSAYTDANNPGVGASPLISGGYNMYSNIREAGGRATMAGKGSEIGRSFEELKAIYDGVDRKERLRVCFDTCHVNDAGYDIVNHYDDVFAEFDRVIGLEQIAVFHVNDSLNPLGAHKDRHANIGKGTIGYDTLHRLVHDETFANVPKILETPWLCEEGSAKKTIPPYKEEIEWLLK